MKKNSYFFDENDDLIIVQSNPKDEKMVKFLEKLKDKMREQAAQRIESLLCDSDSGCLGVNQEHCDIVRACAVEARRKS